MLSYRHHYHAGNHADILKHLCLYQVLQYYLQKPKPFVYIDTHAGIGQYDLTAPPATLNQEYQSGIARLSALNPHPDPIFNAFHTHITQHYHQNLYQGSSSLAAHLLRKIDQLRLFERHPQDFQHLKHNITQQRPKTKALIQCQDGLQGLIASLPPHSRRAVCLIDPSYEVKQDYHSVIDTLTQALKRFSQGCYLLWYPHISQPHAQNLPTQLKRFSHHNHLHASLNITKPHTQGLYGSSMFILNPPYTLPPFLENLLPQLSQTLAQDSHANYQLTYHID